MIEILARSDEDQFAGRVIAAGAGVVEIDEGPGPIIRAYLRPRRRVGHLRHTGVHDLLRPGVPHGALAEGARYRRLRADDDHGAGRSLHPAILRAWASGAPGSSLCVRMGSTGAT